MTMNMGRAFNAKFMTRITLYVIAKGSHNENNDWTEGSVKAKYIRVVLTSGNKFSQFDEGVSLHNLDSGKRFSDYRQIYVKAHYGVKPGDKFGYRGKFYNILQNTDEEEFGFHGFMIEQNDKGWTPDAK